MPLSEVIAETGMETPALPSLPSFSISSNTLGIMGVVFVTLVILSIAGYFIFMKLRYNQTFRIFEEIGNFVMPMGTDKAWFQRIGYTGDVWARTKKLKKVLERPTFRMGKEWWFFRRKDGELINFCLANFNEKMREAGCHFIHEDMRLSRVAIGKMLQNEYKRESFLEKYGSYIAIGILCIIVIVGSVLNTQQNLKYAEKMGQLQTSATKIYESSVVMADAIVKMSDKMGGSVREVKTSGGVVTNG